MFDTFQDTYNFELVPTLLFSDVATMHEKCKIKFRTRRSDVFSNPVDS